jgi:hypothetical protein
MKNLTIWCFLFFSAPLFAQVGIGTTAPDTSAMLEVYSTTKGLLVPRLTVSERNAVAAPATGLLIYQTNSSPGFYYYTGSMWECLATCTSVSGSGLGSWGWGDATPGGPVGDTMTYDDTMRLASSGSTPIYFGVNKGFAGILDHMRSTTTFGYKSGLSLPIAVKNSFFGDSAGFQNLRGSNNTFLGKNAGNKSKYGFKNISIGVNSGPSLDSVYNSIAIGNDVYINQHNTVQIGNGEITRWGLGAPPVQGAAFQVGTDTLNGNGAYLTKGGTWTNGSSRSFKDEIAQIDQRDILNKLKQLPIYHWKYKGTKEYHIGPIAEDFYELFATGIDNKHISTIDPSGISLAAIKQLAIEQEEMKREIEKLRNEIRELKSKTK